ncbi:hypothetical protein LEL_03677 [Akanthomyces lecanii RCEF 1005]|uniref:Uncharacterized protein n=1 Tax=Akanthomyces lecanii RCEF 1005 TaxID=1081108 RepID=A0A168JAF4_CORDF|nr:hypothetical protein LEL_03677 [Akanthomyces lecanii RCEF 1005]
MPQTHANARLRTVAFRTFVGSCCTLVSSIVNLSVLMGLNGEPGWVCLMCCNCDILFSAIVIQWVTSKDNAGTSIHSSIRACNINGNDGPHHRPSTAARGGNSPRRSFSPCLLDAGSTLPSTPADLALTTTTRCCSHGADYDVESCDSLSMTAAKMLAAEQKRPTVIVTTTIERETAPIGSLQLSPPSQELPHKLLGRHRNSQVDTEVAATAPCTPGEQRRSSKSIAPWATYTGHTLHGRSSP